MSEELVDLDKFIDPIWLNTYWVHQALGVYEAIGTQAKIVNSDKNKSHFWGMSQQFALSHAVIVLFKIYDPSNKSHFKHCLPKAYELLKQRLYKTGLSHVEIYQLTNLGFTQQEAEHVCEQIKNNRLNLDNDFLNILKSRMPDVNDSAFKRIQEFRNSIGAHQKVLSEEDKKELPSLEDMERLNLWAEHFCQLLASIIGNRTLIDHTTPCGRMSTLNAIKAAYRLDFNFDTADGRAAHEAFYNRVT